MLLLLWLLAALITYGSLYPFNFTPGAASLADVVSLFTRPAMQLTRGNTVANILLFLPWGWVTGLAMASRRQPGRLLLVSVVLAMLLAVALQVAQLWLPGRNAALGDALINGVGLALGLVMVGLFRRSGLGSWLGVQRMAVVPLGLVLLWLGYRWFPLVPSVDLQNLRDGLKPLLAGPLRLDRALAGAAGWFACLLLLARARLFGGSLGWLALVPPVVTALQPGMVGGSISQANVLAVVLVLALLPLLRHRWAPLAGAGALLIALLVSGSYPFTWSAAAGSFYWVPGSGFLEGSMDRNLLNLVYKSYMYGAVLYLLRLAGLTWTAATVLTAAWLLGIECLQLWLPGRTAEITDPLLAVLLAAVLRGGEKRSAVCSSTRPIQ